MALAPPPTVEVEAADVLRLVLQFCREQNLPHTAAALAAETQVRPCAAALPRR